MTVAITGASGYLGSSLVEAYRKRGHRVICFSRRPSGSDSVSYSLGDDPKGLPLESIDLLIHAAYDFSARTQDDIRRTNVEPSIALLRVAAQAGVGRIVFISSMSCFDGCQSEYGMAKHAVEEEALKLGVLVIRPGLVWGCELGGVMGSLESVVRRLPIVPYPYIKNGGMQFLVHRSDLAAIILTLSEESEIKGGRIISLAHPKPLDLLAILQICARNLGVSRRFIPIAWPFVRVALKSLELLRINPGFRSDSLLGLVSTNPNPELFDPPETRMLRSFL